MNEVIKNEKNNDISSIPGFLTDKQVDLNDNDEEEEPIFMVDGIATTKFPKLKLRPELMDKVKGMIKSKRSHVKPHERYSFQINDVYSKDEWEKPEIRFIGVNDLEIKRTNFMNEKKIGYLPLRSNSKTRNSGIKKGKGSKILENSAKNIHDNNTEERSFHFIFFI